MSIILKLNKNLSKFTYDCKLLQNKLIIFASYSRRSNSKNSDSPFKIVKAKIGRTNDQLNGEGGPNWELLAPKGNRFYLPNSAGPAWQNARTIAVGDTSIKELVDFEAKSNSKLHISTKECPMLLRKNLHELFPAPEVVTESKLCLITLKTLSQLDNAEPAAKNFVLAAKEICARLRLHGFWADFMNPFSGKPFYSYASGKKLYKIDDRFRGLGIRFENLNNCLIIEPVDSTIFTGNIFTTGPTDMKSMKALLADDLDL